MTNRSEAQSVLPDVPFDVTVVRSARRKRTIGARLQGDVLTITIPSATSRADEDRWVEEMVAKFRRRVSTDRFDLAARAARLAKAHDLPKPTEIGWSENMNMRWGSCSVQTGTVRVSSALASFPEWVLDYVIVHELAHLKYPNHSAEFWHAVRRYPLAERAIGFLIAKSHDGECTP